LNLKDIRTILVLFDTANYEEGDAFVKKLRKLSKKVTAYVYQRKSDTNNYSKTNYRIIPAKEVTNLFDNKMTEIVTELDQTTFDIVIDLTIHRNIPLEYVLAHTQASFKTGLKKNTFPQYDLSIITLPDVETENLKVRELAKQIVFYLHTINTK
jgi:hypothetical protein